MAGNDTWAQKAKRFVEGLPGKRGVDIPEDIHDRLFPVANGITQPLWGRPPTQQQLQDLHDMGAHTPDAIHEAFSNLPHPHADGLSVGEYDAWKGAYRTFESHNKRR